MLPPAFYYMKTMEDKIKLEEELEFLKESFEAEVISKDEYEKVKARIEAQLREIEAKEKEIKEEKAIEKELIKEEKPEEIKKEEKKKERVKRKAKPEKKIEKIIEKKEEPDIEIKEIKEPKFKVQDEKEEDTNDIIISNNHFKAGKKEKKTSRWLIAALVLAVFLAVIGYFSFLFFTGEEHTQEGKEVLPLCSSDADCVKEGMIGFCTNSGSKDAKCEFKEDEKINLIILNTKDCFNCDTARVEEIIKRWFPGAVKKEIEFSSEEGKSLVKNLSIELLPAYIFDSNLENAFRYKELKGIFSEINGKYVLSSGASGSTFYINKKEIPNRLDAFLMKNDSSTEKAEENIKGFLDSFKNKIEYNKHLVDKEDSLVKSLDINTFPTFLINNKIRFTGIQSAETIKENFCKANKLEECSKKLTGSLV